jgi:chaperone BCS1
MFELLLGLIKTNPQVAGALTLVIGGSVSYFVRDIPLKLWVFLKAQAIVEAELDNTSEWNGKDPIFMRFMNWYPNHSIQWMSRSYKYNSEGKMVAGKGNQYFMFKGRLFWFFITDLSSDGVHFRKQVINIRCLSRSKALMNDMLDTATFVEAGAAKAAIQVFSLRVTQYEQTWVSVGSYPILKNMVPLVNADTFGVISECLKRFAETKEWFDENHITYKRTFLFSGPPGTGKSTLAMQIAMMTGRDVYLVDLQNIRGSDFTNIVGSIPSGSVMLLEDVHGCDELLKREPLEDGNRYVSSQGPDLSQVLNVLCGIIPLADIITIMTTNYKERLEPALYRPGRVDVDVEVGYLNNEAILAWVDRTYGPEVSSHYVDLNFPHTLTVGEVYRLYELHRDDHRSVINGMLRYGYKELGYATSADSSEGTRSSQVATTRSAKHPGEFARN